MLPVGPYHGSDSDIGIIIFWHLHFCPVFDAFTLGIFHKALLVVPTYIYMSYFSP